MEIKTFLSQQRESETLLAIIIEIKDYKLLSNLFGEQELSKKMYMFKNEVCNLISINVFLLNDSQVIIFEAFQQNEPKTNKIKNFKRKIKKIVYKLNLLERDYFIDVIIGVAVCSKKNIITNANIALNYAIKNNRKCSSYNKNLSNLLKNKFTKRKSFIEIKKAIKENAVIPYYQKIIDNKTGEVFKYEALARIIYKNEVFTPDKFLDAVEYLKLEAEFTRQIVKKVFEDIYINKKINAASINVSFKDIENRNTCALIEKYLKMYTGESVTFEIVETIGVDRYEQLNQFVEILKKYDAKVSIDDFGSGHSGYEHLANIDVDFIKIDGKFTKQIKSNKKVLSLIAGMCEFGKKHNIKIIVEYVEDEETFELLKEIGVDYSQGYYFGKPTFIG